MPEYNPAEEPGGARRLPLLYAPHGGPSNETGDDGPTIRGSAAAIRRHIWIVLLFASIGVGLTAFGLSRSEPLYASRTVIQLPETRTSGGGGLAGLAATLGGGGGSLASQAQVIQSRLLVGQVVDSLGLRLHREISGVVRSRYRPVGWIDEVWISSGLERGRLEFSFDRDEFSVRYADRSARGRLGDTVEFPGIRFVVRENPGLGEEVTLHIVSRREAIDAQVEETRPGIRDGTNLIDIAIGGYDPWVTERTANLTAELYREFAIARTREQAERQRRFIVEQLETTEALLEDTQDRLTDFRRREGLYSSRAQAVMDQTGRTELELRRAELVADRQIYQGLLTQLQQQEGGARTDILRTIIVSPSIASNPMITGAYDALIGYQVQRDSMLTGAAALSRTNRDVQGLDSLIANAEANVLALTAGHIRSLDAQIAALSMIGTRVDSAFQHLAATEPEEIRLMLQLEAIGEAVTELRARFYTAGMAEASVVDDVTILDQALPGERQGTGPGRSLLLGLILGVLVGGAGAIVLDSTNQSIRRRDEVERVLRIPGLGVIPPIRSADGGRARLRLPAVMRGGNGSDPVRGDRELIAAAAVHSPGAEAYRSVRTNLAPMQAFDGPRSIMVTSPSNGEGKTMTAANLAITFAHQGRRVLLIDADLRRARLHSIFEVPREPGLGQVLDGSVTSAAAIRKTGVEGLSLLTAGGSLALSAADVLSGGAVTRLLNRLGNDFEIVIVDSPPVLLTADAPILATQVDGVLLVVRVGQTERETAQYAIHQLASVGADVLGAVLNDPDGSLTGAGRYDAGVYASV